MAGLYVTRDGVEVKDDPDRYILLYMPLEMLEQVEQFLIEYNLQDKFDAIPAEFTVRAEGSDETTDAIKSLMLRMKDDKVLFEYKLRGKEDKILDKLHEYFYGEEEG